MVRKIKRGVIIVIYLIIFFLIGTTIYFMVRPEPSCSDGIKNQGEERADCGGPCQPCVQVINLKKIEIESTEWVFDKENKYDFIIKIHNPNEIYGASNFGYRVIADGQTGEWNESYVLPLETKTLTIFSVQLPSSPDKVEVEIDQDGSQWKKFVDYIEPNLIINNPQYKTLSGGEGNFSQTIGTLVNRSNVDFETVVIKVFLKDGLGKLLAVNAQTMNTVRAGEQRDYSITFPHSFPGSVEDVEIKAETNVFDSENYIHAYGQPEEWEGIEE